MSHCIASVEPYVATVHCDGIVTRTRDPLWKRLGAAPPVCARVEALPSWITAVAEPQLGGASRPCGSSACPSCGAKHANGEDDCTYLHGDISSGGPELPVSTVGVQPTHATGQWGGAQARVHGVGGVRSGYMGDTGCRPARVAVSGAWKRSSRWPPAGIRIRMESGCSPQPVTGEAAPGLHRRWR